MAATKSRVLCLTVAMTTVVGCSAPKAVEPAASAVPNASAREAAGGTTVPALDRAGWSDSVYATLTETIAGSAGQGKVVVFDFDNTTQARDIGEAVLAQAQKFDAVDAAALSPAMFPPFSADDGTPMTIGRGVSDYYDAVLASGAAADPFREYSSLPMPASVFYGRTVAEFLAQTAAVYDGGAGAKDLESREQSTILGAGRPFIYPQMADLYGNLRANGYQVWIVSAGVGWAVRWMVQNALNPAVVAKYGADAALPLDHVVAITMLMKDRGTGKLVSDYELTQKNPDPAYINLEPARMAQLEVTGIPAGLSSWRGGKTGAIDNIISRGELFMVAGDSMGDVEMLNRAPNRLVVSRLNKPELAEGFAREIEKAPDANWMLQPTINSAPVGFLPNRCALAERTAGNADITAAADKSLSVLNGTAKLGSFATC